MERGAVEPGERRVLLVAPLGKDAELLCRELERAGVSCRTCQSVAQLLDEAQHGVGVMLIAEEALPPYFGVLAEWIDGQPPWSDLPVLLLTSDGAGSPTAVQALRHLGNVALIERPVRVAALLSAVQAALRGRLRQYQTRSHLQERDEAHLRKDQFLATLAHELRNPLAPIANCVNLLRRRPGPSELDTLCEIMERQTGQLVRLVDDLMDVSRITRGKITLRRERIDLRDVVATAVEMTRPQLDAARHRLVLQVADAALPVEGDAVRLCQVLSNLLSNAIKYTDPGGRIELEARACDGEARVTVTDNGIGLAREALEAVFELFAQVDAYDMRARGGLGIGLTLARSLVEMHGGSLHGHSDGLGCGSRFELRLPLVARGERHVADAIPALGTELDGRRILVVDDNRDAADSLGILLRAHGARVEVAYEGAPALQVASAFEPDIAILDLGMPGMNGYELARRLRRNAAAPKRLIALSGWGQQQDRRDSAAAGFDEHLLKPLEFPELLARLTADAPQPLPGA